MKRWIMSLAFCILSLTTSSFAWSHFSSARKASKLSSELSQQAIGLERENEQLARRLESAQHEQESLEKILNDARSTEKSPDTGPLASRLKDTSDLSELLGENSALHKLCKSSFEAELGHRYQFFYQSAGIASEKIARFQDLLTEQELEKMDIASAGRVLGLPPSDPVVAHRWTQEMERHRVQQAELLGASDDEGLRRFLREQPVNNIVEETARLVAQSSDPLTLAQGARLLEVVAEASAKYQAGGDADLWSIDWPQAAARAQLFLTPPQFAALQSNAKRARVFALAVRFYQQEAVYK